MRWNENVTVDFIRIYLKNECLWKPSHPNYKCRNRRTRAYEAIATEFKANTRISLMVPEVKMKIKNLRSTYMQEVNKILQKSSPNYMYVPSLIWFDEMDKCLKNISINRTPSSPSTVIANNMAQEQSEVDSSCHIWVDQTDDSFKEENPDPLVHPVEGEEYEHKLEDSLNDQLLSPVQRKRAKRKKNKYRQSNSSDTNSESFANEDEFDIFGKYIASQLRTMHLQKALRLKLEIHSIVNDARISDISD